MKQRSPVDFFRGCVSDVQDFKRLGKIQHVLQRVRKLRVHSVACKLRCALLLMLVDQQRMQQLVCMLCVYHA